MTSIVQSLWIGNKLSELEILSIKSFISVGHIFHIYIYNPIENIPQIEGLIIKDGNTIIDNKDIFTYDTSYLPFSDIFRYKMLYLNGGYWVDLDMICLKKLDFKEPYIFSSERTIQKGQYRNRTKTEVSNIGILKAPANSEFYKDIYNITTYLPTQRQTLVLSATFTANVVKRLGNIMLHPQFIKINNDKIEDNKDHNNDNKSITSSSPIITKHNKNNVTKSQFHSSALIGVTQYYCCLTPNDNNDSKKNNKNTTNKQHRGNSSSSYLY